MWNLFVVMMELCVLWCAWYSTRWALRTNRLASRNLSEDERCVLATMHSESIHRELLHRSEEAGRYRERQKSLYDRLWMSINGAGTESAPPQALDSSIPSHIAFAVNVVGDYDADRERPGVFADCLYRPCSDLPYPHEEIRRCCEFLISIAETVPGTSGDERDAIAAERDALGVALFSLDYFLDLPAGEIPRKNAQNLAFVKRRHKGIPEAPLKPRPGDVVARSVAGAETECVNQVIGIGQNDQWIVLTSSLTPMRVRHNAELSRWEQVEVIAAAAASRLKITPSAEFAALLS